MPFQKGKSGNPKGKSEGTLALHTKAAKAFFSKFTYDNSTKIQDAFDRLIKVDPQAALDLYLKYSERIVPKLSSSTVDITSQGKELKAPVIYAIGDDPTGD